MKLVFRVGLLAAVFVLSFEARAQFFIGPEATALGGAGRAAVSPSESPFLNPAALPFLKAYHLGFFYRAGSLPEKASYDDWAVVFSDNNDEALFPGSVHYVKRTREVGAVTYEEEDIQLAVGKAMAKWLSVGVAGNRYLQTEVRGPRKESHNLTLGVLFVPHKDIGLALVAKDILDRDYFGIPPHIAFGSHYLFTKLLRFRFDALLPQKDNPKRAGQYMLGWESEIAPFVFLRFGHRWDDYYGKRVATVGAGWSGPRLGLDYAFEKNLGSAEEYSHCVDLRLFF